MRVDLMLAWMSETVSGEVRDLRQRIAWLARNADLNPHSSETGRWLRDVSALAHAEIDWVNGRWAVAPAVAVLLPSCGGTAVLAGGRRLDLVERLESQLSVQTMPCDQDRSVLPTPTSVIVQADSIVELERGLADCGVRYVGKAAEHIAHRLPPLRLGSRAAPPAWGTVVERLETGGGDGLGFVKVRLDSRVGLWRLTVQGRPSYLYRTGSEWFHADHATGILWALSENNIPVFRWRHERTDGAEEVGTVFLDQGAPLPPLQARALVLCSGQPTAFGDLAKTTIYRNVPKTVAEQVARSVRQRLEIIN